MSRAAGAGWLVAAVLFLAAAVAVLAWPRGWWAVAALALGISQPLLASLAAGDPPRAARHGSPLARPPRRRLHGARSP